MAGPVGTGTPPGNHRSRTTVGFSTDLRATLWRCGSTTSKTLRFLVVNRAATEIYGYSSEEFLQMTLRDIRPREDLVDFERTSSSPRSRVQQKPWRPRGQGRGDHLRDGVLPCA